MLQQIDRGFGWLLVIGALLHGFGAVKAYEPQTPILVWSLAGSFAALLLAAINLLRVNRAHDRMLAGVSFAGCLCWIGIVLAFGLSIGNILDPRVLYHAIVAAALAVFSARDSFPKA